MADSNGQRHHDTTHNLSPATLAIHADDVLNNVTDVAPPLHVSTTFRYPKDPNELVVAGDEEVRRPRIHQNLHTYIQLKRNLYFIV
jgi:hypothetical protein